MEIIIPIFIGIIGGAFVLFCGWALSHPHLEDCCHECREPLFDGYDSIHEGNKYCRKCTSNLGLKPWYYKDKK